MVRPDELPHVMSPLRTNRLASLDLSGMSPLASPSLDLNATDRNKNEFDNQYQFLGNLVKEQFENVEVRKIAQYTILLLLLRFLVHLYHLFYFPCF